MFSGDWEKGGTEEGERETERERGERERGERTVHKITLMLFTSNSDVIMAINIIHIGHLHSLHS